MSDTSYTELMTSPETAAYLKVKVSTIRSWVSKKKQKLPYVKVGRLVRFRREDVEAYIKAQIVETED